MISNKRSSFKLIYVFIASGFAFYTLCNFTHDIKIETKGLFTLLIYCAVLLAVSFGDLSLFTRRDGIAPIILSAIFSLIVLFGYPVHLARDDKYAEPTQSVLKFESIIFFIGFAVLFFGVISFIINKTSEYTLIKDNDYKIKPVFVFIISLFIIAICWVPYFLTETPSILTLDSVKQYKQIIGITEWNNSHPVAYTLFLAIPYWIGSKLFSSEYVGIMCAGVMQMLLMASSFAFMLAFMYKRRVKLLPLGITLVFFAVFPMNPYYAITWWKDIPFAAFMIFLVCSLITIIEKRDSLRFIHTLPFIISSILSVLFRNNAIYMFPILLVAALFVFNKKKKIITASFAIVFAIYFVIQGPLFAILGIEKSSSTEYIGVPLQQVARMVTKGVDLSEQDEDLISSLIPIKTLKESYRPTLSDTVKFNKEYNVEFFDSHKAEFLGLWFRMVLKHPIIAIDAYMSLTLGYWYPIHCQTHTYGICDNDIGLVSTGNDSQSFDNYVLFFTDTPIINSLWDIGIWVWGCIVCALLLARKKGIRTLLIFVPVFGIWLTLMVASPIFAENRYMYSAAVLLPLFVSSISFMPDLKYKNSSSILSEAKQSEPETKQSLNLLKG